MDGRIMAKHVNLFNISISQWCVFTLWKRHIIIDAKHIWYLNQASDKHFQLIAPLSTLPIACYQTHYSTEKVYGTMKVGYVHFVQAFISKLLHSIELIFNFSKRGMNHIGSTWSYFWQYKQAWMKCQ